jgi:hypothetical protein
VEITRQYDFMADFPLYPLNLVTDLNAVLGFLYVHLYPFDVSLASDASTSPTFQGTHGDTSYYFFETQDLPLFAPLRMLGVSEPLIDVVEPFFQVIVELGYDRSIRPWEPTPARLIPTLDPAKVTADLVNAIGEGINNALALIGAPPLGIPSAPTIDPDPMVSTGTVTEADRVVVNGVATEGDPVVVKGAATEPDPVVPKGAATEPDPVVPKRAATNPDPVAPKHAATNPDPVVPKGAATNPDPVAPKGTATNPDTVVSKGAATNPDPVVPKGAATQRDRVMSGAVSISGSTKPPRRHETPRPVVRGPLGAFGPRSRERLHQGDSGYAPKVGASTIRDKAAKARSSSPTSSPDSLSTGGSDVDGS